MLAPGSQYITDAWWIVAAPDVAIFLTASSFTSSASGCVPSAIPSNASAGSRLPETPETPVAGRNTDQHVRNSEGAHPRVTNGPTNLGQMTLPKPVPLIYHTMA